MPNFLTRHSSQSSSPVQAYPALERALRHATCVGVALVLLLPAARGNSDWLGWMPLWLVGMPLAAWWAMYRFRLPVWPASRESALRPARRRRFRSQARRCARPAWRHRTQAA
ncbi:hypothetical protein [Pseudoxanthomonas sp. UTMC 1351]|uniref:hypothetical protein n=1 Tax=Pseudoxanthomonas sp. UTMC 1351 TaxID=2695853 RepID=UPI0034CF3A87